MRKLSYYFYYFFARPLPISEHSRIARWMRATLGGASLRRHGKHINIEKGATFRETCELGDYSGIGINCELNGTVVIGNNVNMGPECIFYTTNHRHDRTDIVMQKQGFTQEKPIYVGNDVWFCRRAMVMPGVCIGDGSIIAAGAVVTKNVPEYTIVAGNPAVVVRNRRKEEWD